MSVDFTVAIPTYNGASRLPKVLDKLRSQTGTEQISWEVIVVDNNSTDETAQVVREYQADWSVDCPLKYCFELEQGLVFARQRAVKEARGELVGFLDDDNWPAIDWVNNAYTFGQQHPKAGAYGSKIHGKFEIEPPENLKKIIFYLAIIDRGLQPLQYKPRQNGVPPGAGLVVRRDVWRENVPSCQFFTGRIDSCLVASEDEEALLYIHLAGWEIWYNPAMEIQHFIPAKRLEKSYFKDLMRSIGLSRYYLRMLSLQSWQRPLASLLYLVNDTRKVIEHFLRYRKLIKSDIVVACEMERLLGTLISPFYLGYLKIYKIIKSLNSQ
ncbi:MAG TPA: glycosyl transferase [Cyanobacteria bacterium UBA8803]|nr:glycosyl transferase [Cyanobacteria bacterium UBA9273]HBL60238.1 glycosyl transferase [Cyanobacteria bacterium UBA8803]